MSPVTIGIIGFIIFVILMIAALPIPISMGIVGVVGFAIIKSPNAALQMAISELTANFSKYTMSVAPMFILMGFVAYHSGVGGKLFNACQKVLGHHRGGMAMATAVACGIFGAICGSGPATIGTMSAVAYPEMKKIGYHPKVSCLTISIGASISVLIPPSLTFVIYGNACDTSIGRLFISGIIPGILLIIFTCIAIKWHGWRDPSCCPKSERASREEKIAAIKDGGLIEIMIVFLLSIGGLFAGWFTATEAGAIGSAGMIIICAVRRTLTFKNLIKALMDTGKLTAMVFTILGCASIFSRFIAISNLSTAIANWIKAMNLSRTTVLVVILIFYIIMGMFTEVFSIILLTIPVFFPILIGMYGYDSVWFGNLVLLLVCVAGLTPPVGMSIFMIKGCINDKSVTISQIFSGAPPFIVAVIAVIALIVIFPDIALLLPRLVYG